jgi:hypothetical protein
MGGEGRVRIAVCTTWGPRFFGAERFLESFAAYWPEAIDLHVWVEDPLTGDEPSWVYWHSLSDEPGWATFQAAASPDARGDYRQHVKRFSHKVFAYTSAKLRGYDLMIWLDADTETVAPVTEEWLTAIDPGDAVCSYLGRLHYDHSETGFMAFRLPAAAKALDQIRTIYTSGAILDWHVKTDSHAFDVARFFSSQNSGPSWRSLSAHVLSGLHVWPETVLAECLVHHKGPARKQAAYNLNSEGAAQ